MHTFGFGPPQRAPAPSPLLRSTSCDGTGDEGAMPLVSGGAPESVWALSSAHCGNSLPRDCGPLSARTLAVVADAHGGGSPRGTGSVPEAALPGTNEEP